MPSTQNSHTAMAYWTPSPYFQYLGPYGRVRDFEGPLGLNVWLGLGDLGLYGLRVYKSGGLGLSGIRVMVRPNSVLMIMV